MNTATNKNSAATLDKKVNDTAASLGGNASSAVSTSPEKSASEAANEKLRQSLKAVDDQRAELVKSAIDNIKPGRTFDSNVIRKVNKLETVKNRLIVAHFAWLLKRDPSAVHAIVHQIIEL